MATFEQLSAEQRAIIELVLRQGKTYAELSELLDLPEARVRERARAALVELAPISARRLDEERRAELADYVLGQQAGPEAAATRGFLRRSEPARIWTGSLLDSLDGLLGEDAPTLPEGGRRRAREPAAAGDGSTGAATAGAGSEPSPAGATTPPTPARPLADVRRRRLLAGAAAIAAAVAFALLVWPIGLLGGGDDGERRAAARSGAAARGPAGIAVVAERDGRRQLVVQASLPATRARQAYEVWLYNSRTDAVSLGAQVTDRRGVYQGAGPLPAGFARYRFIDVSREPIDRNRSHSGRSVLRGRMPTLRDANPRRGQTALLGQVVLTPPGGG